MRTLIVLIMALLFSLSAFAQGKKVAVVKIVRGEVSIVSVGKTSPLKANDWVEDGAVVKTSEKSFAKLVFIDKSQMNIGPNSEMKIEKFSGNDSGVIDLVKGKIRSQVTKDYLQMKDKDKSKLFIKTPNAVMGIRGTDFMISTNGQNTAAILFEGEVVFNKMDTRGVSSSDNLEHIVDRGVRMHPGEFSVVEANRPEPTVPSLLNIQQRETLEKNDSFESPRTPSNSGAEVTKSVVPEGLNGDVVSNNADTLKNEVAQVAPVEAPKATSSAANPEGYVSGDKIKPANGSFVHVESGVIIPPGPSSVLDKNTNTYIPGPDMGKVATDGSYVPPKNVEITNDGKVFVAIQDKNGVAKVQEIEKPVPVKGQSPSLAQVGTLIQSNPTMINPTAPIKNDILNQQFTPNGLTDISNLDRNSSGSATLIESAAQNTKSNVRIDVTGP